MPRLTKAEKEARKLQRQLEDEEYARQAKALIERREVRKKEGTLPPVDSASRRTIGYNGWSKVPGSGQVFRGHCGR